MTIKRGLAQRKTLAGVGLDGEGGRDMGQHNVSERHDTVASLHLAMFIVGG